jgi:hypothetical protein
LVEQTFSAFLPFWPITPPPPLFSPLRAATGHVKALSDKICRLSGKF